MKASEIARKLNLPACSDKDIRDINVGGLAFFPPDLIVVRTEDTDDGQQCAATVIWDKQPYLINTHCVQRDQLAALEQVLEE